MTYLDKTKQVADVLRTIDWAVFDVDGVLTDGSLLYTELGEQMKRFHVRDGVGIKLLQDMGIDVVVVTAKDSPMVKQRMADLGVKYYRCGVKDKLLELQALTTVLNKPLSTACFVGDDMVDAAAMSAVAVSFCPADAYSYIRERVAHVVVPLSGGQGVARWVADELLSAKGLYEKAYRISMTADFERKR